ncbi:sialin-like [Leptinotarsa decemlineata]|uniref:sialin-like n=1 Tax=Leptinotarsa decemlineata TaxID=7539 RepID=UPI003D30481B
MKIKIPTRFWIGCMVFLTTYTCYTTRVNISVSIVSMTKGENKIVPDCIKRAQQSDKTDNSTKAPRVLPNYGPRYDWDEKVQGTILGGYFYGYVIFSLPAGFLSEYFGPFLIIFWAHVVAAIFNTLTIYAAWIHWSLLVVCRFVLGCCGGLVYPALQCLIAHWAPPDEKGKFVGALMGNVLGTCITWPMVGAITTHFGWDWGFYAVSIKNVIFCVLFYFICSDSPTTNRWITEEERDYIKKAQGVQVTKKKTVPPYWDMAKSWPFWILALCHFGNEWGLYLQLVNVPKFISEVIGFDIQAAGGLGSLPPLTRMIFGLLFGFLGDYFMLKGLLSKAVMRKIFMVFSHIIPGILLIGISFVGCNWIPVMVLLTFSLGLNGACVHTNLQNPQDLAPNFAGTIYGINSFIGGSTGFIVPAVTGALIHNYSGIKEWGTAFQIGGSVYIVMGTIWIIFGSVKIQEWNQKGDPKEESETAG